MPRGPLSATCDFTAQIRLRSNGRSPASWHFVTLTPAAARIAKKYHAAMTAHHEAVGTKKRGRGSIKVRARIGFYERMTSIFPDSTSGSYLLPLKAEVRTMLQIVAGDSIHISLTFIA